MEGAVKTIICSPSAAESLFGIGINNVIVPDGSTNSCVISETMAFPSLSTARIETPSATPAVRYVNVSGTFIADVPMIFGKWTALKYSGTSVDVVIVVTVLVEMVDVEVVSVELVSVLVVDVVTVPVDVVMVVMVDVVEELVVVVAVDVVAVVTVAVVKVDVFVVVVVVMVVDM